MGAHVAPKIFRIRKGSATVCATKRGHAAVHYPLVLTEPRGPAETASTIGTTVRLLPSVDTEMAGECRTLCEGPLTVRTVMRSLLSVYGPVRAQGRCPTKALAAVRATERLFTRMSVQMRHQRGPLGKTLLTVRTAMRPFSSVYGSVHA